ncbi:TIGR02391 family protein [Bradyrhizobium arachidis]|uniref:TIGR02391 family protein n=1 Tax=Bradyrhizobium arachidis TaxID=858423 RepID=UPI0021612628|nr:TIGR02391 family protein [Bradyrhizobium arachidis]UVO31456.1 TIGR02391 family protein [Bradyrhizobium arachidis]
MKYVEDETLTPGRVEVIENGVVVAAAANLRMLEVIRKALETGDEARVHPDTKPRLLLSLLKMRARGADLDHLNLDRPPWPPEIRAFMQKFPPHDVLLAMEPEHLGKHLLKYFNTEPDAVRHWFDFMQRVMPGKIADAFTEAWHWMALQGFIVHPGDVNGQESFMIGKDRKATMVKGFDALQREVIFPSGLDADLVTKVKPAFIRGDYSVAVNRAFTEVTARVREKDPSLANKSGEDLLKSAFGPTGPLMRAADQKERSMMCDLFVSAYHLFRRPAAQSGIKLEDSREVLNIISLADQLLRMVARL